MYDKETVDEICNKYEEVITAYKNQITGLENQIDILNKLVAVYVEIIDCKDQLMKEKLASDNYSLLTKWSKT